MEFGLTKRERFAMAAMQGLLSYGIGNGTSDSPVICAGLSREYADALIAELDKDGKA